MSRTATTVTGMLAAAILVLGLMVGTALAQDEADTGTDTTEEATTDEATTDEATTDDGTTRPDCEEGMGRRGGGRGGAGIEDGTTATPDTTTDTDA